jgi:predicted RNase H-like HicB family nuclease
MSDGQTKMNKKLILQEYLNMPWHFAVKESDWEGEKGHWAWVSELPDCSTFGHTQAEALATVEDCLPIYLKAALDSKVVIDEPSSRDVASAQ